MSGRATTSAQSAWGTPSSCDGAAAPTASSTDAPALSTATRLAGVGACVGVVLLARLYQYFRERRERRRLARERWRLAREGVLAARLP